MTSKQEKIKSVGERFGRAIKKLGEESSKQEKHVCCDGECNHDDCCGKVPENCPHCGELVKITLSK